MKKTVIILLFIPVLSGHVFILNHRKVISAVEKAFERYNTRYTPKDEESQYPYESKEESDDNDKKYDTMKKINRRESVSHDQKQSISKTVSAESVTRSKNNQNTSSGHKKAYDSEDDYNLRKENDQINFRRNTNLNFTGDYNNSNLSVSDSKRHLFFNITVNNTKNDSKSNDEEDEPGSGDEDYSETTENNDILSNDVELDESETDICQHGCRSENEEFKNPSTENHKIFFNKTEYNQLKREKEKNDLKLKNIQDFDRDEENEDNAASDDEEVESENNDSQDSSDDDKEDDDEIDDGDDTEDDDKIENKEIQHICECVNDQDSSKSKDDTTSCKCLKNEKTINNSLAQNSLYTARKNDALRNASESVSLNNTVEENNHSSGDPVFMQFGEEILESGEETLHLLQKVFNFQNIEKGFHKVMHDIDEVLWNSPST